MKSKLILILCVLVSSSNAFAQKQVTATDSLILHQLFELSLTEGHAYARLGELCKTIGPRLSGSDQAEKGVNWAFNMLSSYGFDKVDTQGVMVPRWVRGTTENVQLHSDYLNKMLSNKTTRDQLVKDIILSNYSNSPAALYECESYLETNPKPAQWMKLPASTLGGSVGGKFEAQVISVKHKEEIDSLGKLGLLNGKIVLLNRPMNETELNTFKAYGGCVSQRVHGSNWCSPYGALAVLVRSVSNRCDLHPHTGTIHYADGVQPIPMIAVATAAADVLEYLSHKDPGLRVSIELDCKTLPDRLSANVMAQQNGSLYPDKIIVFGGHFDSWDIGEGAHDDGAGCMHAFEALRLLKAIGYQPRHTLRCVFWINEENGVRGGKEYARVALAKNETHVAALESDRGGYTPRGFGVDSSLMTMIAIYKGLLEHYGIGALENGGGGVDISPLKNVFPNIQFVSFIPDSQRYFDVHHAETDVFENVNKRELALGAAAIAAMIYIIDQSME